MLRSGAILLLLIWSGCDLAGPDPRQIATLSVPGSFDPVPIPAHNPLSREKVELGEKLFFDPRLSSDGTVACSSCHLPGIAFADPRPLSPGVHGRLGIRNSPSLVNVAYVNLLFWDGGAFTLESQALGPLENPVEMDINLGVLLNRIEADPEYEKAFQEVFGSKPTVSNLTQALGSFQRTIRSGGSRYDRYLAGEREALSGAELRGKDLFEGKAQCSTCHSGFLLTDQGFKNNGIGVVLPDSGRARITLDPNDFGTFRTPSLRNVALTRPYMHDGRFSSLEAVVDHYNSGGTASRGQDPAVHPLHLEESEKADLVAFLNTLTDDIILTGLDHD